MGNGTKKSDSGSLLLDVKKIEQTCDKYGMDFQYRLIYRPDDTFAIFGTLQKEATPAISFFDQRKKVHRGKQEKGATTSLTLAKRATSNKANELEQALRGRNEKLKKARLDVLDIKQARKNSASLMSARFSTGV